MGEMLPHDFVAKMYGCQSQGEKKLRVFAGIAFTIQVDGGVRGGGLESSQL